MSDTQTSAHTLTSMHECLKSLTHTYALCRCRNEGTSLQTLTLPAKCCALSEAAITESLSFLVRLCHSKLFSENICMWIQLFVPSRLCFFLYLFKSFSVECAITGCKIFFALFFFYLRGVIMCYVLLGWGRGGFGVGEVKLSLSRQREREMGKACRHGLLWTHQIIFPSIYRGGD